MVFGSIPVVVRPFSRNYVWGISILWLRRCRWRGQLIRRDLLCRHRI
jgi:hypothetical protein